MVVDPNTGGIERRIPVIGDWSEPEEWQQPRPALEVRGSTAYVTDPANLALHAVDLTSGEITTGLLEQTPNEISAT